MAESSKRVRRYKHAPHAAWRRVDGEAIVLDLNTSVYYSLNDTGASIWERLGQGEAPESIAEAISGEFAVQPAVASQDIEQFVARMLKERLLVPA